LIIFKDVMVATNNQKNGEAFVDLEAGESTYLLDKKDGKTQEEVNDDENVDTPKSSLKEKIVNGAAAVAVGTSVVSMLMVPNPLVLVSGGLGSVLAPFASMQEKKLVDLELMKDLNEKMETQVQTLTEQNNRLEAQKNELEGTVSKLEEMENALATIKKSESQSVDSMEEQLNKSKSILNKMKKNMKATVLQNIISVAIRSDSDGDRILDDGEIDLMLEKLKVYDSVEVNEDRFRKMIVDKGRDLGAIMSLVRNLMTKNCPEDERVIKIHEF